MYQCAVSKIHLHLNVHLETKIYNGHTFFKDYQHVENTTIAGSSFFTQSDVSCCIYNIENTNPPVTTDFINDLEYLTSEYIASRYR